MKLNLGSGDLPIDGYENLDIKTGQEVSSLVAYADNSLDEIRASHILEHFGHSSIYEILNGWVRKLRPGGILRIAVPDFGKIAKSYIEGKDLNYAGYLMGGQTDSNDYHKAIFDRKGLSDAFGRLGLCDIKEWQSEINDCASLPISLNLQGTKAKESNISNVPDGDITRAFLNDIKDKAKNIYSQNGEDGVIEAIFNKIGTNNKWCLEVGAADGILFSNTRYLLEQGWTCLLIESDTENYKRLVENCKDYANAICENIRIEPNGINSLDNILKKHNAPKDIDLVCIDVDGQDWHIWNQMIEYIPRVVVVEYNPDAENPEYIPSIKGIGQAGLDAIQRLCSSKGYHTSIVTDTNVISVNNQVMIEKFSPSKNTKKKYNIKAVMSMPRLCFADNIFAAVAAMVPYDIPIERGIGVFWGQVLSRMIKGHLNDGTDLIFTIDYDTYFTKEQVSKLVHLMHNNPDYDAICALQMKREEDSPLFGKKETDGTNAKTIQINLNDDIVPVDSGHFGLTVFRASSLKKLSRPWFVAIPNSDGEWGEGRKDEDIYFWENFKNSGLKLGMAHKVGIGHLQLLTTFPGTPQEGYKPVHLYNNDVQLKGIPQWCKG